MNNDQITGIVRAIIPGIVGYLAGKGLLTPEQVGVVVPALVTVISTAIIAVWSFHNNKTGKVIGS